MRLVEIEREAQVIRFSPTTLEPVLRRARQEYRAYGRYGLSVWASVKAGGETDEDLHRRILKASSLAMDPARNPKFWLCSQAGRLLDLGFVFYKNENEDEPPEHYSVDLGPELTDDVVRSFLDAFVKKERPVTPWG